MNFPEKMKGENSKEYAYRALKDNIMSLELKPGQNINESEISQQLKISRTPVREILMKYGKSFRKVSVYVVQVGINFCYFTVVEVHIIIGNKAL